MVQTGLVFFLPEARFSPGLHKRRLLMGRKERRRAKRDAAQKKLRKPVKANNNILIALGIATALIFILTMVLRNS